MLVFATRQYQQLGSRVLAGAAGRHRSLHEGKVDWLNYPDGERQIRVLTNVKRQDVALIAGTPNDAAFVDLLDLASGLVSLGASSLRIVIPYWGYSTNERRTAPGEVVCAAVRARMISALPKPPQGLFVTLMDLHAEASEHFFDADVHPEHLYCEPVNLEAIRLLGGTNFVVAGTDLGRSTWIQAFAKKLGTDLAFCRKVRISGSETEVQEVYGGVRGRRVVMFDDMYRTGGSAMDAARAYRNEGAVSVLMHATHGVLPNASLIRLVGSELFETISVNDTHPRVFELQESLPSDLRSKFVVHSVGPLIGDHLVSGN